MLPIPGWMQSHDSLVAGKITALTGVWKNHQQYASQPQKPEPFTAVNRVFDAAPSAAAAPKNALQFQQELFRLRLAQLQADKGVSVNASYVENFSPAPADDDLIYKRRVQSGVEWNLLHGGYNENRSKEKILANESTIARLRDQEKGSPDQLLYTYNSIIYLFNLRKTELIAQRKKISEEKLNAIGELYYLHQVPQTKFMEAMQQQVQIASQLQLYQAYNDQLKNVVNTASLPGGLLPAFDVDQEKLMLLTGIHPTADSIRLLQGENFSMQSARIHDIRLAAGVRYNYYDMISTNNRGFVSAGLNFSMPIYFSKNSAAAINSAQLELQLEEQRYLDQQKRLTIANYFYEFRYKLKQYADFSEKRKLYVELLRIERVKEQFNDLEFNPLTALTLLDDLISIDIEMTDITQQLYLKLLDIREELPGVPVTEYTQPYKLAASSFTKRPVEKSIFIWSAAIREHANLMIVEYLRFHNIRTAFVSVNTRDKTNLVKTLTLIDSLNHAKIAVEALVGNNNLIKKDIRPYLDSLVSAIGTHRINGIHLDVEPHTFTDWDTKKQEYLAQYVTMLKNARTYCNGKGWKLTVSIPVFYPEETLREIYSAADEVVLMAYEHPDATYIIKKIAEEMRINPAKTTVALRAKDFKNRQELESLIAQLAETAEISTVSLHDFSTLMKLDEAPGVKNGEGK